GLHDSASQAAQVSIAAGIALRTGLHPARKDDIDQRAESAGDRPGSEIRYNGNRTTPARRAAAGAAIAVQAARRASSGNGQGNVGYDSALAFHRNRLDSSPRAMVPSRDSPSRSRVRAAQWRAPEASGSHAKQRNIGPSLEFFTVHPTGAAGI